MLPKEVATERSRKSCFRTQFGNQRINWFQTPLKVARHHYYPFFPWIPGKFSWKKTSLLWSYILRLFANTLNADDKYSLRNMQNFLQQLQTLFSQKRKTFSGSFIPFQNCASNLKHFEKKDECPSLNISEIIISKRGCYWNARKSCFRTPFGNQRINWFQTPLKVARHHYYPFFAWISGKLSWKKTVLLWSKILRLFANTFTADDKYSCRNMQNFRQELQTLLSQKWKTLSGFFIPFLKCAWNLEHFEKKDECPSLIISKIIVSERGSFWNI